MKIIEENIDLITVDDKEYYLVQCITADFASSTGIGMYFDKKYNIDTKKLLEEKYGDKVIDTYPKLTCILCDNRVFNLIIKKNYYHKATYESVKTALVDMKKILLNENIISEIKTNKIAMPKIGCGLDGLEWYRVKRIIEDVFDDTNVEILVCNI